MHISSLSNPFSQMKSPHSLLNQFFKDHKKHHFIHHTARFIGINERRWNDQSYPILVNSFNEAVIADIDVGFEFILALDFKGDVWAWGSNNDGQLGLAHTDPQPVPVRVPKLQGKGIAQVSAGMIFISFFFIRPVV